MPYAQTKHHLLSSSQPHLCRLCCGKPPSSQVLWRWSLYQHLLESGFFFQIIQTCSEIKKTVKLILLLKLNIFCQSSFYYYYYQSPITKTFVNPNELQFILEIPMNIGQSLFQEMSY